MTTWTDKTAERFAELTRHARGKSNTLGDDGDLVSEPYRKIPNVVLPETWRQLPSADNGLVPPNYDSYGVEGDIGTRRESLMLHSYIPSGTTGPNSVQTFFVVSSTPSGHGTDDIESVRMKNLISPVFSQSKSTAAHNDPNVRGFELVLYPAKSSPGGGVGDSLIADEAKPIPTTADPGGGTPIEMAPGLGDEGFYSVDYMGGIVRLSRPPLNGSGGVFNPNDVYGDINGTEVASDAYGTITMFATFYQYTGSLGEVDISTDIIITVGDGYLSTGVYTGNTNNIVQAALNSFTGGGGTVFIKEGDYTFDDSVVVSAGQTVIGLNGRVTVVAPSSDAAFKIDGSDVAIEGLKIRTSGSGTYGSCIELSGNTNGETIENVSVRNNTLYCKNDAYGVEFSPDTFDITYKNVEIRNNIFRNEFNEDQVWNAVGTNGETQTSTGLDGSGMTWVATTAAGANNFNGVAHDGKGLWCGVGSAGTIETSHDGEIWVAQTAAGAPGAFQGIAHDGIGLWCAVGFAGEIQTSPNGENWTAQTNAGAYAGSFFGVAHDKAGLWCIVGQTGEIQTSPDGINWTAQTADGSYGGVFRCVAHDENGLWCIGGATSEVQTSTNGVTWVSRTITPVFVDTIFGAAYNGELWCIVGGSGEIHTSLDGTNWIARTAAGGYTGNFYGVAHDGSGLWCIVGTGPEIQTSPDAGVATAWAARTAAGAFAGDFHAVAFPPAAPIYIGEIYEDGYYSFENLSIVENQFEDPDIGIGTILFNSHAYSLDEILISQNMGKPRLDLTGLDGYMTEIIITNNSFKSVDIGDFGRSIFSDNIVQGNVSFTGTSNSKICDNQIGGQLDPNLYRTILTGNNIRSFVANSIRESEVTKNIVVGTFGVGADVVSGNIVFASIINENILEGAVTIGAAMTGTVSGRIFSGSTFSGNALVGACTFGAAGRDQDTPTYENFKMNDNEIPGATTIRGLISDSIISNNTLVGDVTTDNILRTDFNGNNLAGAFVLSVDEANQIVLDQSTISDNKFGSTVNIGGAITGSGAVLDSVISGNIMVGAVTVGTAMTGTTIGYVLEASSFINNKCISTVGFGAVGRDEVTSTYLNSSINNNQAESTLIVSGKMTSCDVSNNNIEGSVHFDAICELTMIGNNFYDLEIGTAISAGEGIIVQDSIISNNVFGATFIGDGITLGVLNEMVLDGSIFSNNRCLDTLSFANTSRDEAIATYVDSIIDGNIIESTLDISGRFDGYSISNNIVGGAFGIDNITDTNVISNKCSSTLTVGQSAGGTAILNSNISSNNVIGAFSLGDSVDGESIALENSIVNENIITGAVTVGAAMTGVTTGSIFEDSVFSGNVLNSTCAFGNAARNEDTLTYENFKMTNNEVSGTTIISGSLQKSVISDNTLTGDVTTDNMLMVSFSNNQLVGIFALSEDETDQIVLDQSVISNNIFGSSVGIGAAITGSGTVLDSIISGNIMVGAVTVGTAFVTGAYKVFDDSVFSGNILNSTCAFGNANRDPDAPTYENFKITNNEISGTTVISGSLQQSVISDNTFTGAVTTDNMLTVGFDNNQLAGAFILSVDETNQIVLDQSVISNNIFGSSVGIGDGVTDTGTVLDSVISGNIMVGAVTIGTSMTGTTPGYVMDGSMFNNNKCMSAVALGHANRGVESTFVDSIINDNIMESTLTISGNFDGYSISNNVIESTFAVDGLYDTIVVENRVAGNVSFGTWAGSQTAVANCNVSNNIFENVLRFGPSITSGAAIENCTICENRADYIHIGASMTQDTVVNDSMIDGNIATNAVTIGAAMTGTTAGLIFNYSSFSNNILQSTCAFGNAGRNDGTNTYTNSIISNNILDSTLDMRGQISDTCIVGNIITGAVVITAQFDGVSLTNNIFRSTYATTIPTNGIILADSIITGNRFEGTSIFSHSIVGSAAVMESNIFSCNHIGDTITFGSLTENYNHLYTDSAISGNVGPGGLIINVDNYDDFDGLMITGNAIGGAFEIDDFEAEGALTIPTGDGAHNVMVALNYFGSIDGNVTMTDAASLGFGDNDAGAGADTDIYGTNIIP